jgi:hypothetical protein
METNTKGSGYAIISLILGLLGIIAWIIPLAGLPITVIGLILGIIGLRSRSRGLAIAGLTLCSLFLAATIINASIGAYMGATGQHQFINGFINGFSTAVNDQNIPSTPTRFPTKRPTKTHVPGATQVMSKSDIRYTPVSEDQAPSGCTLWSNVSLADVGKTKCVYGTLENTAIRDGILYLTFSNNPEDFYFVHYGSGWWEGAQNTCHLAEGKIEQLGRSPVMVIDQYDLYLCE